MVETWRVTFGRIRQRLLGYGTGVVDERWRSRPAAERGVLASVSRVAPAFGVRFEQLLRSAHANGANGSTVVGELALRRDSHPEPECHQRRVPRHEARGPGYWF
jgi:hypothetical protein